MNHPSFTISLDFELFWGVRDLRTIKNYGSNIIGARFAITEMLSLFEKYEIHCTWATVGLLYYDNKENLIADLPKKKPAYKNKSFSPYPSIHEIGQSESIDPYHFGLSLIKKIQQTSFQEIGTHTFAHYYCLEEGQTIDEFEADLKKAIEVASKNGIETKSLIFPRNQFNNHYLEIIKANNIKIYRGNERSWIYDARNRSNENLLRRSLRLLDSYINISGQHVYDLNKINDKTPFNAPSSRFLRPYSNKLKLFEGMRLRRIKKSMLTAAKENKNYHLWWHPHNFGLNTKENITFLKSILEYYLVLKKEYGMMSRNMGELANILDEQ